MSRDQDTDRDGLTDWWETKADASVNKYGHTDPKNRDSDNDGAIDGGGSNVYNGTLHLGMAVDTNKDGVADYGEMDLNGDGIIEMGEENYYETPPNEVTYFLDIFAVADREYRDYYKKSWDADYYKKWINYSVDKASVYFMRNFSIKLKVVEISKDVWNSDDALPNDQLVALLKDAIDDFHWENNKRNADALLAFTGKDPDYEGIAFPDAVGVQIPELSDPRVLGFWEPLEYLTKYDPRIRFVLDPSVQLLWTPRLVQHEVSHLFGAYDYGLENPNYHTQDNVTGERLARIPGIMDKTKPTEDWDGFIADPTGNIFFSNEWNLESILIINANKTYVTNGSYKK